MAEADREEKGLDGSVRKAHYGAGRQPWDDIVDAGWGPIFAAANVLKYVRRHAAKNGEDDLQKAHWYYDRLTEFVKKPSVPNVAAVYAGTVMTQLLTRLTDEELKLINERRRS